MINLESYAFTFSIAVAGIVLFASGGFGRDKADKYILRCLGASLFIVSFFAIALAEETIRSWVNLGLGGLLGMFLLIGGIPGIRVDKGGRREVINAAISVFSMGFCLLVLFFFKKL